MQNGQRLVVNASWMPTDPSARSVHSTGERSIGVETLEDFNTFMPIEHARIGEAQLVVKELSRLGRHVPWRL